MNETEVRPEEEVRETAIEEAEQAVNEASPDPAASEKGAKKRPEDAIITIPNILSIVRICLIPVYMYLYFTGRYWQSIIVIAASALTDILDGFIARTFHMESTLGRALDPVADKLSQFTLLLCLLTRFPHMIFPAVLIAVKEITSGILGLVTMKKTGVVKGAVWHGKLTTVLLYAMMMLHIVWYDITPLVSDITIAVCVVMMLISFVLYTIRYFKTLKAGRPEEPDVQQENQDQPGA